MEEPKTERVYKTKPYQLKAIRAYYSRNKVAISKKNKESRFLQKSNILIDCMDTSNDYVKWILLFQLTSYKEYQTNVDVRLKLKDRLLSIINSMNVAGYDLTFLKLGGEYGDEQCITYDGNR